MKLFALFAITVGISVSACSGDAIDDGRVECSQSNRTGTYLAHAVRHPGGTCADITDELVRLDPDEPLDPLCQFGRPDQWSHDQCTLTREIFCPDFSILTVSKEVAANGARLEGVVTLTARDCVSTYDVTWVRQ